MRRSAALAAGPALLLAALAGACVTEELQPGNRTWTLITDPPAVAGGVTEPSMIAPAAPSAAPVAAPPAVVAQDAVPQDAVSQEAVPPGGAAPVAGQPAAPAADGTQRQNKEGLLELITPVTEKDLEPDFLAETPPSPFHRLGHNVIRGMDGSWSKMYSLKTERSQSVVKVLQATVPGFPAAENTPSPPEGRPTEIIKYALYVDFYQDTTGKLGVRDQLVNPKISDMLIVTAPPETLLFIDQVLDKLLADLPQIELQVRVVEVNLDDLVEWDSKVGVSRLQDPGLPFDPVTNPVDGHFGAGFPILDAGKPTGFGAGFGSFLPPGTNLLGFLLSLQGVHDGVKIDAMVSLLQSLGASELISSPTVSVLNGHRAIINTGSKVPVFKATGIGVNAQISTEFQDTGVKVEMIPFIVNEDVIRIDLSVDVSAVTAEVPFNLAGTEVATPVISTRNTGTTVHVHSGQVFAVGGLRSRESIETITKVPVLGDIPLLGWLFKSRASRLRNTEILFFVTPTIRIPSETLVAPIGP